MSTLQTRIHQVQPGTELRLDKRVYRGNIQIDKPLTITGTDGTVIEGTGQGSVITVSAPGVTLRDLTIRGDGGRLDRDDSVVLLKDTRGDSILDCRIRSRAFGIYVYGGGNHRIENNRIQGTTSLRSSERGNGIHLWKTERNRVIGNRIRQTRDSIYLSFAHDNRIAENRARNLRYGIHYMYSERNRLRANQMVHNVGGIALMYSKGNRILSNRARENQEFGILLLQLEESVLRGNLVTKNQRGFFIQNSARNDLTRNTVLTNHTGVYLSAGSTFNRLYENTFQNNVSHVYLHGSKNNDWHRSNRGNYWDGYIGFDRNGDGIGDFPHPIESLAGRLTAQHPTLSLLVHSPFMHVLNYLGGWVQNGSGAPRDPYPLMRRPSEVESP